MRTGLGGASSIAPMSSARVVALYRYPVKGLTPEPAWSLRVLASGAVEGDRVLGLLLADAGPPARGQWWPKQRFVTLMTTPGLARLHARFDADARRLNVTLPRGLEVAAHVDDPAQRETLEAALTDYVAGLEESPRRGHPERGPLRLQGDGLTPRFHDRGANHVTLLNRASLRALAEVLGAPVDERRFRGNVALDGLPAWAELGWAGATIALGGARFRIDAPIVRCQATHTDPDAGAWDLPLMQTLVGAFGHERPMMGVLAEPLGASTIEVGAPVEVLDASGRRT